MLENRYIDVHVSGKMGGGEWWGGFEEGVEPSQRDCDRENVRIQLRHASFVEFVIRRYLLIFTVAHTYLQ